MANLNELTNEQREAHRVAVCVAVGLDPNPALGHLDYIWMPQENGLKNLVLYARRGTTELLRDINDIDVKTLDQHDGPGYVSFKVTAVNKKGRQEIAIGAHETEGLKNKKLADAIATAQTRALRRVTLQFAGHGILDESEVTVAVVDSVVPAASSASLAGSPMVVPALPAPAVAPSSQPGKDITSTPDNAPAFFMASSTVVLPPAPVTGVNETVTEPKKRRGRRPRNTVALESPGQPIQTEMPAGHLDADGKITPIQHSITKIPDSPETRHAVALQPEPIDAIAEHVKGSITVAAIAEAVLPTPPTLRPGELPEAMGLPPKVDSPVISDEKKKEYADRLRKYSQDILPKAGMVPSEQIGGSTMKLRKFAGIHCGTDATKLTEEQFEDLLGFLDNYAQQNGASALVEYINKSIGAK